MSDILPRHWKELDSSRMVTKFDDLGNTLFHAMDEILCGSSNYRPLIPASESSGVDDIEQPGNDCDRFVIGLYPCTVWFLANVASLFSTVFESLPPVQ